MKSNQTDLALAIIRIGFAALMLTHGVPKLQMLFSGEEIKFASILGMGPKLSLILAVIGEFVAPLFIIVGFKTKLASIFPLLTMLIAALVYHAADPIGVKEKALLYVLGFIVPLLMGAGKYSVDGMLSKK
jgi:putative oxidoreductase